MRPENLTDRVRAALRDLHQARRFSQVKLADRLKVDPSSVSHTLNKPDRPITLDFLEAASQLAGVRVAELVAEPGSVVKELNPDEAALLRALRNWPLTVTRSLVAFVAFFADEEPAATQTRNLHELWRHLNQRQREAVYGFAVMQREGSLPPEITAKLYERLSDESKAAVGTPKRRTTT